MDQNPVVRCRSGTRDWLTTAADYQCSCYFTTLSTGVKFDQIGRRDATCKLWWWMIETISFTGQSECDSVCARSLFVFALWHRLGRSILVQTLVKWSVLTEQPEIESHDAVKLWVNTVYMAWMCRHWTAILCISIVQSWYLEIACTGAPCLTSKLG